MPLRLQAVIVAAAIACISTRALAEDKGGELEFAPETVEKSGPPSQTLQQAIKFYEASDFYSASIQLQQVVEGKSGDGESNRQRAEFWLAKTLYHLGYYSASLAYFDRIVQKGDSHRYYNATLKWLASLSQKLPESSGILEKLGKYDRSQIDQPELAKARNELYYLVGRYHYLKGNLKEAVGYFGSVAQDSPFFARAKFMEGISYVRNYKARPAADAFKVVLRTALESPDTPEIEKFRNLAQISLARVFYSTRQFDLSVKYYDQIPRDSPLWLESLFESGWAHFMRNNFSRALGNIHTLNAPYFEDQFFPESPVLKAVIYWKNCLYDRAAAAVSEFNEKYPPLKKEVDAIVSHYKDPTEFYDYVVKVRNRTAGLDPAVRRLVLSVLSDLQTAKAFEYVQELDRELQHLEGAEPVWKASAVAAEVLQDLTLQRSLAQNAAGDLARRRVDRLSGEINELQKQAIKVEYEIIRGRKNELEATLRNEQVVEAPASKVDITADDEHNFWPFRGEYWRDELGYYRFEIASRCTR